MSGIKSLRRIQLGKESTAGTSVAATALWRGMGTLDDEREVQRPDEDIGFLGGVSRTYIPRLGGAITFEETEATFEQLPYLLAAGVENVTSGTQDTGGSGYIYQYDFPTTSTNTVQSYTIEGGDNQQEEEMYYGVVTSIGLSGAGGEALMMTGDWVGRQVQKGTFTTQPSVPTVEEILASKGTLYIDDADGTIGSTAVSDTLLSWDLSINTGIIRKWTGDNNSLDFSFIQYTDWEVELSVTFEHNGSAVSEKDNFRNETARLIRLDLAGSDLTTAGSSHSTKLLRLDLPGTWDDFEAIGEQDGNDVIAGTFVSQYEPTAAIAPSVVVVNELSSLT